MHNTVPALANAAITALPLLAQRRVQAVKAALDAGALTGSQGAALANLPRADFLRWAKFLAAEGLAIWPRQSRSKKAGADIALRDKARGALKQKPRNFAEGARHAGVTPAQSARVTKQLSAAQPAEELPTNESATASLMLSREERMRQRVTQALQLSPENYTRAARIAKLSRSTFIKYAQQLGHNPKKLVESKHESVASLPLEALTKKELDVLLRVQNALATSPRTLTEGALLAGIGRATFARYAHIAHLRKLREPSPAQASGKKQSSKVPLEEILAGRWPTYNATALKKRLLSAGILKNVCSECKTRATWQGKPLVLQLDHKNGDSSDHRFFNLRLLCPNCHSQTETYTGRNRGALASKPRRRVEDAKLLACLLASRSVHEGLKRAGLSAAKSNYERAGRLLRECSAWSAEARGLLAKIRLSRYASPLPISPKGSDT